MKTLILLITAALLTTNCATTQVEPTPYQPAQKISPTEYGPGYVI